MLSSLEDELLEEDEDPEEESEDELRFEVVVVVVVVEAGAGVGGIFPLAEDVVVEVVLELANFGTWLVLALVEGSWLSEDFGDAGEDVTFVDC